MGVYIQGMEMPLRGEMLVVFPDGSAQLCYHGVREPKARGAAIPVPPHGRLIDADKIGLTDFEIVMCEGSYKEALKMLLEKIKAAPTVIPADHIGDVTKMVPEEEGEG